jgi:hypothetical protein
MLDPLPAGTWTPCTFEPRNPGQAARPAPDLGRDMTMRRSGAAPEVSAREIARAAEEGEPLQVEDVRAGFRLQ